MQPHEKDAILRGIKFDEEAKLREQDGYREVIEAIQDTPPPDDLSDRLHALAWEEIEKHMAGECWPPADQDWQELYGRKYDETPKHMILSQIADKDIRFRTYHYSGLADHTLRLKAMAHYYSLFGAINADVTLMFLVWKECAKVRAMELESKASVQQLCRDSIPALASWSKR